MNTPRQITYFFCFLFLVVPLLTSAQDFTPLVSVPFIGETNSIEDFIQSLYFLAISVAAFLAVVMIILGGVKYMLSDVVTDKSDAKKDIKGALLGLLIVLAAVLMLETINPQLTNLNVLGNAESQTFLSDGYADINNGLQENVVPIDDPKAVEKLTELIEDCPPTHSYTIREVDGNYVVECNEDNLENTDIEQPLVFEDGELVVTDIYDPESDSLSFDCVHEYNAECFDKCDEIGGGYPDKDNPHMCVISGYEPIVDELHCDISGSQCTNDSIICLDGREVADATECLGDVVFTETGEENIVIDDEVEQLLFFCDYPPGVAYDSCVALCNGEPNAIYNEITTLCNIPNINTNDDSGYFYTCAGGELVADLTDCSDDVIFTDEREAFYIDDTLTSLDFSCNYSTTNQVESCENFCNINSGQYDSVSNFCNGATNPNTSTVLDLGSSGSDQVTNISFDLDGIYIVDTPADTENNIPAGPYNGYQSTLLYPAIFNTETEQIEIATSEDDVLGYMVEFTRNNREVFVACGDFLIPPPGC